MGLSEKKINYSDLQAYKEYENQNFASIPGWNNKSLYQKYGEQVKGVSHRRGNIPDNSLNMFTRKKRFELAAESSIGYKAPKANKLKAVGEESKVNFFQKKHFMPDYSQKRVAKGQMFREGVNPISFQSTVRTAPQQGLSKSY